MTDTVRIIVDEKEYFVPAGENLVDMVKWYAGNDIPVFCYHPKLKPAGMCRMCLVEMGTIQTDRESGEVMLDDDGNEQIRWFPILQTACTQQTSDGLVIRTDTKRVEDARKNVMEFLLTSHPLDCPTCDKGGECSLQNLAMSYGHEKSRMYFEDKLKSDKIIPLGDLILLDRERCIQCARCIRFQDELVGDAVLAFHQRGRKLQIITNSEPGFKTYFSGNTTDICPVGALTSVDFRFGARPWELTQVPSICPHDAAGTNISLSMRADGASGGRAKIKRVLPRQNEYVNELWASDKTRFGYHFAYSDDRLQTPMICKDNEFHDATWEQANEFITDVLKDAGKKVAAIAGSGMSNEDLFALRKLVEGLGGDKLGAWPPTHGGADIVAQVGVGKGTTLGDIGDGDAILVIASDLEEEVPIWRLRIKQAHDNGAYLVVANARHTRLADFADDVIEYAPGYAAHAMDNIKKDYSDIAKKLAAAHNLLIVAGSEGVTLDGSKALMQAAMNFLVKTKHVGIPNNGLLSPFPGPNGMGLHYMGFTPEDTLAIVEKPPKVLIVAQAELLDDDPDAVKWLKDVEMVISLNLFPDKVGDHASVMLPIQSFAERDGSFTNGERRVQRFYMAQGPMGEALPAWQICSRLGEMLKQGSAKQSAVAVMHEITQQVPEFAGMSYKELGKVYEYQLPDISGDDMYYGGTALQNTGGLGVQVATEADAGKKFRSRKVELPDVAVAGKDELLIIPSTRLYNRQNVLKASILVHSRIMPPYIEINNADAVKMDIAQGDCVDVIAGNVTARVIVHASENVPQGAAVLPRHLADAPTPMTIAVGKINKVKG